MFVSKGFIAGVAACGVAALAGGLVILEGGFIPANADAAAGPLELWAAGTSLEATVRREAPKGPNPVPPTDANLIKGVALFSENCIMCHGTSEGDASASPVAKGEYPRPPQLAAHGVEDDPEGVIFWKIKHGVRLTGMPAWGYSLSDQQIWTLALFLKHMDQLPPHPEHAWQEVRNQ
jgi:mono/diheme cytochrome c family protein